MYLHEYVDIVGEGAMRYMEHTVGFNTDTAAGKGLELLGTFYVMGSTGRWPQVVNIWECLEGRTGWRKLMESTNLGRTKNPALNEWWKTALEVRSGGFDRLLGAAPGCPTIADLRSDAVSGSVFVHELSQCKPGAALDYLAAVRESWEPVARRLRTRPRRALRGDDDRHRGHERLGHRSRRSRGSRTGDRRRHGPTHRGVA